jgi:arginyl-tRNA synthetase
MQSVLNILEKRISEAMSEVSGQAGCSALVRPATDAKFGDYQVNGVMPLAKQLKTNPRKLAEQIVAKLNSATADKLSDICEKPEVAGPGFINLRLKPEFVAANLMQVSKDPGRLGVEKESKHKTVVVDFSGPNIAKDMHVGHLRSTIIGDCIRRLLNFQNHKAIWQNHFGDWGTNFGMVILGLWHICMAKKHGEPLYYHTEIKELKSCTKDRGMLNFLCCQILKRHEIDWLEDSSDKDHLGDGKRYFYRFLGELERAGQSYKDYIWRELLVVYQYINALEDTATGMGLMIQTRDGKKRYESLSSYVTYMLQRNDKEEDKQERMAWRFIRDLTLKQCDEIYKMLGIDFNEDTELRGESFYSRALGPMVKRLVGDGETHKSEDAICLEVEGFKNKDGVPLPFMIQKSDGAHLYQTFDLEALRWRVRWLKADKIIYVTDARQSLHFQMLFKAAEKVKWDERLGKKVELVHVTFGSVLGEDGKPLKTRSGENVKLKELLDEAVERARKVVEEKNPDLADEKKDEIAKAVGIGAVKYADYSNNRTSDYIFSFDKMLAMEGNTAPYMQYAYARIKSIERKAVSRDMDIATELAGVKKLDLSEPSELDLAKHLIRYGEAVEAAAGDYRPNYLTSYLYDLAQKFSGFYANCPVLDASADKRPTRLLLCDLTARTIEHGLHNLLGIEVIEQM